MVAFRSKAGSPRPGWFLVALTIVALACFASAPASAQTWIGAASNSWFNPVNWSGETVPSSASANAVINSVANNPVTLGETAAVGTLSMGVGTSLDINSAGLQVAGGSISNGGVIDLTAAGSYIQLDNNLTLSGAGTMTLTGGQIGTNGNAYTLTNQSTIHGYGTIGSNSATSQNLSLANSSIIDADSSGNTLSIQGTGGSITNTGTFEATGGGILSLATNAAINNSGGLISASGSGSTVNVSTTIQGGTLTTSSGGVIQTSSAATLDGTTQGAITISDGSTYTAATGTTKIVGTLNLGTSTGGTLALGSALELTGNTTLSGPGVVNITGDGTNSTGGQIGTNGNAYVLANNATIQGSGTIGSNNATFQNLNLVNNGTIDANTSGAVLSIQGTGGAIINSSLLEATNGGILSLATSAAIGNLGTITAGTGSTVDVSTTIEGGTLTTLGTGVMQTTASGATLDALGAPNVITLSDGSTYTATAGTTKIEGTLNLGTTTGSTLALGGALELINDTTLDGPAGAVVNISGVATGSDTGTGGQIGTNGNQYTLTNNVTIQGTGVIGSNSTTFQNLNLVNNGTIDANTSAGVLAIGGTGNVTNAGLFEATNGGILNLGTSNPILNNNGVTAGTISADGGTVNISTVIEGGTLSTSDGGVMQTTASGATLDALTDGAITLADGSTYTSTAGTTKIQGTLNLGTTTGSTLTLGGALELTNNTSFDGPAGAVVNISGTPTGVDTGSGGQIGTNGNQYTLTNNVTIQGTGVIGSNSTTFQNLNLINNGTIDANTNGGTLAIGGTGNVTNNSLFEATNGGTLNLGTATPINNSGGAITASGAGSTVDLTNVQIQGGTLTTNGGGVMQTVGTSTLNALTEGAITLSNGSTLTSSFGNGIQTDILGTLNLGTGGGATLTLSNALELVNNTTLQGAGGVVNISGTPTGVDTGTGGQIGTNGNSYTLTNDVTIQGTGVIGSNSTTFQNLNLINNGTIDANTSGQTLAIGGTGTVTNNSVLEATNGGILELGTANPLNNSAGSITANGAGSTVNIVNMTMQGGSLTTENGGAMNMVGTSELDGTTQGAITLTDGSTLTSGASALTKVVGAINLGTSTGGTLSLGGQMQLVGNTTFSGPGAIVMTGSPIPQGSATGAQIGTNGNAYTLTNETTIEGSGLIGSNVGALFQNLTVVNGANGTFLANAGNPLVIGGTGSLTNNGTLQANTGSTLIVTNNLTNYSAGALTGGTYNANGGTIQLNLPPNTSGGEIVTDAGNIILNGASAAINDGGGISALSALATISANGSLSLLSGAQLTTSAANLANNGTLTIGAGSALNANSFTQGTTGTLNEQVAGTSAGQWGVTNVSGAATLGAGTTLDVTWEPTFDAGTGDDYILTFLDAADGLTGTYGNVDLNCPVDDTCSVGYTADTAYLGVDGPAAPPPPPPPPSTPEPSTFVMMASGIASLAAGMKMRNRRRNTAL